MSGGEVRTIEFPPDHKWKAETIVAGLRALLGRGPVEKRAQLNNMVREWRFYLQPASGGRQAPALVLVSKMDGESYGVNCYVFPALYDSTTPVEDADIKQAETIAKMLMAWRDGDTD